MRNGRYQSRPKGEILYKLDQHIKEGLHSGCGCFNCCLIRYVDSYEDITKTYKEVKTLVSSMYGSRKNVT